MLESIDTEKQMESSLELPILSSILGQEVNLPNHINVREHYQSAEDERASKASKVARNMDVWIRSPWAMIEDQVIYTVDQVDILNPIKLMPAHDYLKEIVKLWMDNPLFACYKSRRRIISWTMVFLHLHLAMFNEGVSILT